MSTNAVTIDFNSNAYFSQKPIFIVVPVREATDHVPQGDMRAKNVTLQSAQVGITNDEAYTKGSYAHWLAIGV